MTDLQDEESVVVEVDAAALEQLLHLAVVARTTVDSILAAIVLVRRACYHKVGTRDNLKLVRPGL